MFNPFSTTSALEVDFAALRESIGTDDDHAKYAALKTQHEGFQAIGRDLTIPSLRVRGVCAAFKVASFEELSPTDRPRAEAAAFLHNPDALAEMNAKLLIPHREVKIALADLLRSLRERYRPILDEATAGVVAEVSDGLAKLGCSGPEQSSFVQACRTEEVRHCAPVPAGETREPDQLAAFLE